MAFLVAVAIMGLVYPRHDPVQERVEELLKPRRLSVGGRSSQEMVDGLIQIGPQVIPHLARKARRPSKLSQAYGKFYLAMPVKLVQRLPMPEDDMVMRGAAIRAIKELGPLAVRQAAPEMIAAVGEIGPLTDDAMGALPWLLPEDRAAQEALRQYLIDTNRGPRMVFTDSLGAQVWPGLSHLTGHLVANLSHPTYPTFGAYAALALGEIGPKASNAVPALVKVLQQTNTAMMDHQRAMSAYALGAIGQATPEVVTALANAWNDTDPTVRRYAAGAVDALGSAMAPAMPQLLAGLNETYTPALFAKFKAVGKLGPAGRDALGKLRELSDREKLIAQVGEANFTATPPNDVRSLNLTARMSICRLDPNQVSEQLKALVDGVTDWWELTRFLMELKSHSPEVIRTMEPLLDDLKNPHRRVVAYVILHHDRSHAAALRAFDDELQKSKLSERIIAASGLFDCVGRTNLALPLLAEGLASSESHAGKTAIDLAERLGSAARPAIPAIKGALWHKDRSVRERAGLWLRKHAPEELPAIAK
ncbi:MAG: HEAT repeat domain-containing protein [Verrucomicrobiota bacterium]